MSRHRIMRRNRNKKPETDLEEKKTVAKKKSKKKAKKKSVKKKS